MTVPGKSWWAPACGGMQPLASLLAFALLCAPSIAFARASAAAPQMLHIAGLDLAAWLPEQSRSAPAPVIIFSHGFHGCNTQSTFLTAALARSGYAVFAPNHRDAACRNLVAWFARPEIPFRQAKDWSDNTYADRARDMTRLLDALSADSRYRSFDWQHVGAIGHSLGGYTVLQLGGASASLKDRRVKAVLALSPYAEPFAIHKTLAAIDAPVMYQGGTRDFGITPFIIRSGGAYDQTPAPKYFVEFDGAGHFAWTDMRATYHDAIVGYARGFFDHCLKGKPFSSSLSAPHRDVTVVKIEP
jgi:predicted dienelactone hydrolase